MASGTSITFHHVAKQLGWHFKINKITGETTPESISGGPQGFIWRESVDF